MLFRQGDQIFYKSTLTTALVDVITPQIIEQRLVAAKFSPIFAAFIAYHGGIQTHEDALQLARTVTKNGKALIE